MNYQLELEKIIKNLNGNNKLLLHSCCAPCSSAVLERLASFFQITIFYYNPNINSEAEYQKRILELKRFLTSFPTKYPIELVEGRYDPKEFYDIARGLEEEPERGKRCFRCYQLRLEETAKMASELGYAYFATTLTLSPHKNAKWINEIGEELDQKYTSTYLYSDFKKKNGYQRSIELSREYDLYRQDYCGCVYSIRKHNS